MSRIIILTAAALCYSTAVFAQANRGTGQKSNSPTTSTDATIKPFNIVEQMPAFKGDMIAFVNKTLHYPDSALAHSIAGRCAIRFVVAETGSVTDAEIIRSSGDNDLDAEALRVVRAMPPWKPGRQSGKIVPVYYTLLITFALED